jgi:hypothetical protein
MKMRGSRFLLPALLAALLSACASSATKFRPDRLKLLQQREAVDRAGSGPDADALRGASLNDLGVRLAFVTASIDLSPNDQTCVLATCNAEDRIVNCGAISAPPTISVLTGVIAVRHPEDDPNNVLVTDSCAACYSNVSPTASLAITARATCLVGGRTGALVARGQEAGVATIAPAHPDRNGEAELEGNRMASSKRVEQRPRGPRDSGCVRVTRRRWRRKPRGRRRARRHGTHSSRGRYRASSHHRASSYP